MHTKKLPGIIGVTIRLIAVVALVESLIMLIPVIAGVEIDLLRGLMEVLILILFATPLMYYFAIHPYVVAHNNAVKVAQQSALEDPLTMLPNRRQLDEYVAQSAASASRHQQLSTLLFIDLDGFKRVNDEYGHQIGDELLISISSRLKQQLRVEDVIFRVGGDEFVVLIHHIGDNAENARLATGKIAHKLLDCARQPVQLSHAIEVCISCSIGISMIKSNDTNPASYIREADQAMYFAKQRGKDHISYADELGLTWNLLAQTGNPRVDQDHARLETLFNEVMQKIHEPDAGGYIQNLFAQIKQHFDYEEAVALKEGLNLTDQHRTEHVRISAYLDEIMTSLDAEPLEPILLKILEELRLHVLHVDTQLTKAPVPAVASKAIYSPANPGLAVTE